MSELQQRISSREFIEYLAYFRLNPFGEERADLRMAISTATIANRLAGSKKDLIKPQDLMIDFSKTAQTEEEKKNVFLAQMRAWNKVQEQMKEKNNK